MRFSEWTRSHVRALIALLLGCGAWALTVQAVPDLEERLELAARFRFAQFELDDFAELARAEVRRVHADLEHIAGWISTVGAALALNDLDHDGLSNDLCYVEPRTDLVIIRPVPSAGPPRYSTFCLRPAGLRYDPETMAPMGCVPADLNEDGRMDVVVYYWGRTPVAFLGNEVPQLGYALPLTERSFVARELVLGEERWFTNALSVADVDGDGHQDLLVGNYFPDGARVLDGRSHDSQEMPDSMSRASNGGRNRILLWKRGSSAPESQVAFEEWFFGAPERQWTLALGAADLDGDALPEVYVANDFGPDRLFHNRSMPGRIDLVPVVGRRGFSTPRSKVLGGDSFKGMGVDFSDLNGDGLLDIHVGNISTEFGLQESNLLFLSTGDTPAFHRGEAPYVERSEALGLARSGWAWDVRFGDFDNDGGLEILHATGFLRGEVDRWPELHEAAMGNDRLLRNPTFWHRFSTGDALSDRDAAPFFVRASDGRYWNLAKEIGLGAPGVSRAIATADVDADGRLDFAVAHQWEASRFFHNESREAGAFLGLYLRHARGEGPGTILRVEGGPPPPGHRSLPVVGAVARVQMPGGRRAMAQVEGGNGHSGKRAPELHFGLGDVPAGYEVAVEITWRSADGSVARSDLRLTPGWHTLWLKGSVE